MKEQNASLRSRLVISIGVAMFSVMLAVSVAVYWAISHESDEIFKARLATSAKVLEGLISQKLNELPTGKDNYIVIKDATLEGAVNTAGQHPYEQKVAFQVWSQMGVLLAKSDSAPVVPLGALTEGVHQTTINAEEWQVFALRSGDIWVMAAEHNDVLAESTVKLMYATFTPFVMGSLALIFLVNYLLLKGLSPIQEIAHQISKRDGKSDTPILGQWPAELSVVVEAFNHLLARVRQTIMREKMFLDSAAHEIRTPITAVHLHLQNAMHAQDPVTQQDSMKQAYLGAQRASRLVSQMMELSRMDSSEVVNEPSVFIALDEMAQRFAKHMQLTCMTKGQSVVVEAEADVVVFAPLCDIESIFSNILDNAFKYGYPNSVIRMVVQSHQGQACLQVTNQGPLIAAQDKLQIFLPYFRNTEGAQSAISGSGLGLAIVKRIADRLKAQVSVRDEHGPEGTTFELLFPLVV